MGSYLGNTHKFYIYKEIVKGNKLSDKYAEQPNKIFETILEGEGHVT
jgi:uncharacterized protein (DUF111 family)